MSGQLQLQRYRLSLTPRRLHELVARAVEAQPLLNESFLTESPQGDLRLVGLHQYGDIVLSHAWDKDGAELTLAYRQGDRPLATCLTTALAAQLRKPKPTISYDGPAFENLAQFLQSLPKSPLGRHIVIADSALDSALTCTSQDFAEILEGLMFLKDSARHEKTLVGLDADQRHRLRLLRRRHRRPFIMLHENRKLYLAFRLEIPSPKSNATLRLHFAPMTKNCYLIGYVDETRHEF